MAIELSEILRAFESALPGEATHKKMAPPGRTLGISAKGAKIAAVLCLLYPVNNQWHFVFIERASKNKKDKHYGQIAFPGGMYEPGDKDLLNCALREAKEEINLDLNETIPIRALSPLYIPVSNFQVYPFLAYTHKKQEFIPQYTEVNKIISFSLAELLHPGNIKFAFINLGSTSAKIEVPSYSLDRAFIWGATAMILHECMFMLKQHFDLP